MTRGFSKDREADWQRISKKRRTGSVQDPRTFIRIKFALDQATGHLHADAQHRLGDLNVLTLQERLGILGEIQSNQGTLVLSPSQLDSAIW